MDNKNKPFLKVGDKTFSLTDLYCALFDRTISPDAVTDQMLKTVRLDAMMLCQKTKDGVIQATCESSDEEYPCAELLFRPNGKNQYSIEVARVDQPAEGDFPPEAYLYGRGYYCIAQMSLDIRSDGALVDDIIQTDLLVSGNPDNTVKVTMENEYVTL